jgi:hypothetical protein
MVRASRNACDQFTFLEVLGVREDVSTPRVVLRRPTVPLEDDPKLIEVLQNSVSTASSDDGWANLAAVGVLLRKWQPDFDSRIWNYAKLSELVGATGMFLVEPMTGAGPRVRCKPPAISE